MLLLININNLFTKKQHKVSTNNLHFYYCLLTLSLSIKIIIKKTKNSKFCPSNNVALTFPTLLATSLEGEKKTQTSINAYRYIRFSTSSNPITSQILKNVEKSATLRLNDRLVSGGMEVIKRLGSVIPRQLCDNAGFDATDVLNKLRQKHAMQSGEGASYGVDINTGGIADSFANFVWEPAVVKINAINAATEAACLILSVDETVKNPKSESAQGDAAAGAMGRGRGGGRGRGMRRR
ncbi:BnaAnng09440D [Brassica napus]|uniref:BnaAnng09440D protein n=1 Tax=Brassica napus TaxID=3708 RepID=A0A078ICS2_BRANA|nr:BnaAnng09440D [Brassica napus]